MVPIFLRYNCAMLRRISPIILFLALLVVIVALTGQGPRERTLGVHVRLVYLHGAWVWTALASFITAALCGLVGLVSSRTGIQHWSIAWGQAGTFFWITYLPLSLLIMQANWNGLYLAEPRWKIGVDFAIIALLLQTAILIWRRPAYASVLNIAYLGALLFALGRADQVMHPASPILASNSLAIQFFFLLLVAICMISAWQLSRYFHQHSRLHA